MNGKGDTPRPLSVSRAAFADKFDRIFSARRELTRMMQDRPTDLCPVCHGEGRDPNHWKNACPACDSDGKRKEAA